MTLFIIFVMKRPYLKVQILQHFGLEMTGPPLRNFLENSSLLVALFVPKCHMNHVVKAEWNILQERVFSSHLLIFMGVGGEIRADYARCGRQWITCPASPADQSSYLILFCHCFTFFYALLLSFTFTFFYFLLLSFTFFSFTFFYLPSLCS